MRMYRHFVAVLAFLLAPGPLFAASIKTKDGQVVEGKITGVLVQKGEVEKSQADGKTTYAVKYYLANGSDIATITEEGVKLTGPFAVCEVFGAATLPDDLEVLVTCADISGLAHLKDGTPVIGLTREEPGVRSDKLLGEFRRIEKGKGRLFHTLEVTTSSSTVTIPVSNLAPFKPAKPNAKE